MNKMMSVLVCVAAFLFSGSAIAQNFRFPAPVQTGQAPVVCPNAGAPVFAKVACANPVVAAQCGVCIQVNVTCGTNCPAAAPATDGGKTPDKRSNERVVEVVCEGGKTGAGCLSCASPEMVSVLKSTKTQYRQTSTKNIVHVTEERVCVVKDLAPTIAKINAVDARLTQIQAELKDNDAKLRADVDALALQSALAMRLALTSAKMTADLNNMILALTSGLGELERMIYALNSAKPQFSLGANLWLIHMGDAGTAVAPGLQVGFKSYFPESKAGYYAQGFAGLMYRDGLDLETGGRGSAYHAGFEGGFVLALSDDRAWNGTLGFRMDQIFRTTDPNFLGTLFGGSLGVHYTFPGTYLSISLNGAVNGSYRVVYLSDDRRGHYNDQPLVFAGGLAFTWAADL